MRGIVTKLAVLTFLTIAIAGCGADVNVYLGGGGSGGSVFDGGRDTGYYYLEDARYDYWWYYSDGSQWWHWDDRWVADADFVWYDDQSSSRYYEYDPSDGAYYDDPFYWDDVYYEDIVVPIDDFYGGY